MPDVVRGRSAIFDTVSMSIVAEGVSMKRQVLFSVMNQQDNRSHRGLEWP